MAHWTIQYSMILHHITWYCIQHDNHMYACTCRHTHTTYIKCISNSEFSKTLLYHILTAESLIAYCISKKTDYVTTGLSWLIPLPGWRSRTSNIFSTCLLYAVIWKMVSGVSWIHVMLTGTTSSDTRAQYTSSPSTRTSKISAHNLQERKIPMSTSCTQIVQT